MPVHKIDLLKSTYTRGVTSRLYDRAQRRAIIRELDGAAQPNNTDLSDAIEHLLANEGEFHPLDSGQNPIPLAHISVTRFGPTKVLAVMDYRRRSFGSIPTQPSQVIAKFRSTFRTVDWYRTTEVFDNDNFFPSGNMIFAVGSNTTIAGAVPRSYPWQQPAYAIHVPAFLTFNPASTVSSRLGATNSDNVAWGGMTFQQNTIRFEGLDVDWLDTPQGNRFNVLYSFLHVRGGFWRQFPFRPDESGPWGTQEFPEYEQKTFAGVFTVNN